MAYDYFNLLSDVQKWLETQISKGLLSNAQAEAILKLDHQQKEHLFSSAQPDLTRPLIVAFMGGTGVGKSSLLNRLAGQGIARAGIERPTSKEVTLYHHAALSLKHLPDALPLSSIKISAHHDIAHQSLVWLDMPDFDSVDLNNRQIVLDWLPHIDVLIYVVSPERYRDNKAWQLLLAEGSKHAWLFVMNQWDRGDNLQLTDFKRQLGLAGFKEPLIYTSSCTEPDTDQFQQLLKQIQQLAGSQQIIELEQRQAEYRRQQLYQRLQQLHQQITNRDYQQLINYFEQQWQTIESQLDQGLAWPLQQKAQQLLSTANTEPVQVWDGWAQTRFDDFVDQLSQQALLFDVPAQTIKLQLSPIKSQANQTVTYYTELVARQSLLNPGNKLQRILLKLTSIAETLLPISTMAIVAYQVFSGYYYSSMENKAYLGLEFAIHSVLLILLSWLIPFFLHKKIQPSQAKAALYGLKHGLAQALVILHNEISANLLQQQQQNQDLQQQLASFLNTLESVPMPTSAPDPVLARMLINQ